MTKWPWEFDVLALDTLEKHNEKISGAVGREKKRGGEVGLVKP